MHIFIIVYESEALDYRLKRQKFCRFRVWNFSWFHIYPWLEDPARRSSKLQPYYNSHIKKFWTNEK